MKIKLLNSKNVGVNFKRELIKKRVHQKMKWKIDRYKWCVCSSTSPFYALQSKLARLLNHMVAFSYCASKVVNSYKSTYFAFNLIITHIFLNWDNDDILHTIDVINGKFVIISVNKNQYMTFREYPINSLPYQVINMKYG